jgi:hypothetical protein
MDPKLKDADMVDGYNNDTMLKEIYFKLPDHCSVFQTELSAIKYQGRLQQPLN